MPAETFARLWNPPLLAGAVLGAAAYLAAAGPLRPRFPGSQPVPAAQVAAFLAALATLYAAVGSPLDAAADELFSAHMLQHLLLVLVAAPLLLLGTPRWMLPRGVRALGSTAAVRWLLHPVAAFAVFNGVFDAFHLPALYELTLTHPTLHETEHVLLVLTALLLWRPICAGAAAGGLPPVARLRYLLANTVAMAALCAALAFAGHALYPSYARTPAWWPLTPLQDQQLGAALMMLGATAAFTIAVVATFLQLFDEDGPAATAGAGTGGELRSGRT